MYLLLLTHFWVISKLIWHRKVKDSTHLRGCSSISRSLRWEGGVCQMITVDHRGEALRWSQGNILRGEGGIIKYRISPFLKEFNYQFQYQKEWPYLYTHSKCALICSYTFFKVCSYMFLYIFAIHIHSNILRSLGEGGCQMITLDHMGEVQIWSKDI